MSWRMFFPWVVPGSIFSAVAVSILVSRHAPIAGDVWGAVLLCVSVSTAALVVILQTPQPAPRALTYALLPVGLTAVVAALSPSPVAHIAGFGIEAGTLLFILTMWCAYALGFLRPQPPRLIVGGFAALLLLSVVFGDTLQAGWYAALLIAASPLALRLPAVPRWQGWSLLGVGAGGTLIYAEPAVSLVTCVLFSVAAILCWRVRALALWCVVVAFGAGIWWWSGLGPLVPGTEAQLRPSLSATVHVIAQASAYDLALVFRGAAGGTFESVWAAGRPRAYNALEAWQTDLPLGYSTMLTLVATMGIPFVLLLCGGLIAYAASFARAAILLTEPNGQAGAVVLTVLFLLASLWLATPPLQVTVLLLWCIGIVSAHVQERAAASRYPQFPLIFLMCACVSIALAGSRVLYAWPLTHAEVLAREEATHLTEHTEAILHALKRAAETPFAPVEVHLRYVTQLLMRLEETASADDTVHEKERAQWLSEARRAVERAHRMYTYDYRTSVQWGRVLVLEARERSLPELLMEAQGRFQTAHERAPMHPGPLFALAQTAAFRGDKSAALEHLRVLLYTLKSNFLEARTLAEQLGGVIY